VDLVDPGSVARVATLSLRLQSGGTGHARLTITYPRGAVAHVRVGPTPLVLSKRLLVGAGHSTATVTQTGPVGAAPARILATTLIDDAFLPFQGSARAPASTLVSGLLGPACEPVGF
jgi:hypothetical protein